MAKRRRVLLVEDEPSIAEAIGFLLTRDGCEVTTLADGTGVLAMLRGQPVDALILFGAVQLTMFIAALR
ncbi:MAG: hypothetical protein V4516_12270, partial [Pseudomonadota bacterium]